MKLSEITPEIQGWIIARLAEQGLPEAELDECVIERLYNEVVADHADNALELAHEDFQDYQKLNQAINGPGAQTDAFHACIEHGFYVCERAER